MDTTGTELQKLQYRNTDLAQTWRQKNTEEHVNSEVGGAVSVIIYCGSFVTVIERYVLNL